MRTRKVFTAKQVEAAIAITLANVRADVVQSWGAELDRETREQLWCQFQAIEKVEESIRNDFRRIIERAAGYDAGDGAG
jgi:hypothetical protein